jgi:hypothetical protein
MRLYEMFAGLVTTAKLRGCLRAHACRDSAAAGPCTGDSGDVRVIWRTLREGAVFSPGTLATVGRRIAQPGATRRAPALARSMASGSGITQWRHEATVYGARNVRSGELRQRFMRAFNPSRLRFV